MKQYNSDSIEFVEMSNEYISKETNRIHEERLKEEKKAGLKD